MIYLAGSCSSEQRTLMTNIAKTLRQNGYYVYCPFEIKIEHAWDYSQEDWSKLVFEADKKALDDCDIFIMISPGRVSTAGTNWEQGYMYGKGKRVLVFQFTEEPTSLMTFCGCSRFINTTRETIYDDILLALNSDDEQEDCKTTLT